MIEEIRLPRPQDICKGDGTLGNKHCAAVWLNHLFQHEYSVIIEARKQMTKIIGTTKIAEWNDAPERTLEEIASAIEKTVERMGYVIYE